MRKVIASILAFIGLGVQAAPEVPENESVIDGMRKMALNIKADELGLTQEVFPYEVYGVLMETGFENGGFTLVVLADGTTSLYFSNRGGIIGAGTHDTVKKSSTTLLSSANHYRAQTKPAENFLYPSAGQVKFYFIGRSGVTIYTAQEQNLGENKDPLSQLFHASHVVISELRKIDESRYNK